ncbi:sigma-70 family RNA polymerase sigma factor [Sorangium sp. So ce233]|uniref:sigma-70 family RNA polymerase sigma factor n=1 Tax=Sorangium sp. So ce233 TaxID=3133290 RepID=UPI003F60357C
MVTPTERALLERLHRHKLSQEPGDAEPVSATVDTAIQCCEPWLNARAWRAENARLIAAYREDWACEAQTAPLAVELNERSAAALRRLAAEMDWLLEDAARFAIRNLYDAYDDQVGLGEAPAAPAAEPAPAPAAETTPALPAPLPPPAPVQAPAPVAQEATAPVPPREPEPPRPPAHGPAEAPEPAPEAPAARERREQRERRPRATPPTDTATPKPRITHTDIAGNEEVALIRRLQAGDRRAGDTLLEAHERLILKIAMRYRNRGLDDDDLIQWARMGFLRAATGWSETEGAKLATYAVIWMKQHLQRAVDDQGTDIRVPVHMHTRIRRERRAGGLSEEAAAVHLLLNARSLDAPVPGHEDDGDALGELTAGPDAGPEAAVADEDAQARRRELIDRAMTWLTPREQEVIQRMVLADDPETLDEVGASFDRTRERIRQIKVKALEKLERAVRRLVAEDDAVLWGRDIPAAPLRPRQAAAPAALPPAPAPPVIEPAPSSRVFAAAEPPRAKPVAPPPTLPPRPTPAQIAAILPLKPPTRKLAEVDVAPTPRSADANRAMWEFA